MKRIIAFLLLTLLAWLIPVPTSASSEKAILVFEIDKSLSEPKYADGPPIPQGYTPRKNPQVKKRNTAVVKSPQSSGWYNPCSCVSWARYKSGINVGSIRLAKYHPINSNTPSVGAILITNEGWGTGHLAYVESVQEGTTVTISEANFTRCKVTSRTISISNPVIRGYYK